MEETAFGLLFSGGLFLTCIWFGYRGANIRSVRESISENDIGVKSDFVSGNEVTIEGDVIIDCAANETYQGESIVESVPAALVLWRIRKRTDPSDGWDVVESGIESGEFKIDTGTNQVRVDTEWLVDQHGDNRLDELTPSGLKSTGLKDSLEAKTGNLSAYVYLDRFSDTIDMAETTFLPSENYDHIENSANNYQILVEMAPDGKSLTVHGQIDIDQGEVVVSGSDSVPMAVSNTGLKSLKKNLRSQMIRSGIYAFGSIIASASFFYFLILPELPI